jgi:hypothetical protein
MSAGDRDNPAAATSAGTPGFAAVASGESATAGPEARAECLRLKFF